MSDPVELIKKQNIDAREWAKSFVYTIKKNRTKFPEEGDCEKYMIGWFASAIMVMHDKLHNEKITKLQEQLKEAVSIIEFIDNVDFGYCGTSCDSRIIDIPKTVEAYLEKYKGESNE